MIKFVILAGVFVTINALSEELANEAKGIIQEYGITCAEQEKASADDLTALMEQKMPVSHEGKCTIFCTLEKMDVMKADGSFGDGMADWMERVKKDDSDAYGKMVKMHDTCKSKVKIEDDPCETAVQMAICAKEEGHKSGMDKMML